MSYPASGFYGANALAPEATAFVSGAGTLPAYDLAGILAPGSVLKLTITGRTAVPDGGFPSDGWWLTEPQGWLISTFDHASGTQTFPSTIERPDVEINFTGSGHARLDYYECGSATPTRTKTITGAPALDADATAP